MDAVSRHITDREWMSPTFEARRPALPDPGEGIPLCERCGEECGPLSAYCGDCEVGCDWHRATHPEDYCPVCGVHNGCDCPEAA